MRGLLRLRTVLVLAVVLVVAYAGVSWVFSDKLIAPAARPLGKVDPTEYGLPKPTVVEVPGKGGVKLASWYFENPRNERCAVIMLHGFSGARAEVVGAAPVFWDRGCDLLMYDSRGHGDSSPALLTFGPHEKDDLVAAIAWLSRRTKLLDKRIGLIGWSYGAAVSIQAAAKVPDIGFVIADSSYSSLEDIARMQADHQFGAWAKVLLIHSRQDGFTPYQHSEKIYAASNKARTRLVIPAWAAPHAESYRKNNAGYTKIVDRFLKDFKLPPGPRKGP